MPMWFHGFVLSMLEVIINVTAKINVQAMVEQSRKTGPNKGRAAETWPRPEHKKDARMKLSSGNRAN